MINVKHPDEACNIGQQNFINSLPEKDKKWASLLYSYGNATYIYHSLDFTPTETDYIEWLSGLENPFKKGMQDLGFDKCKSVLSFTRYVREKNDVGMEEFVKGLMGDEYFEYKKTLVAD